MAKPTKPKFVADLKAHITATYPGAVIKSSTPGYEIYMDPVEANADFFIVVHDRTGMQKLAAQIRSKHAAAVVKKQQDEAKKRDRESATRRKATEKAAADRAKARTKKRR